MRLCFAPLISTVTTAAANNRTRWRNSCHSFLCFFFRRIGTTMRFFDTWFCRKGRKVSQSMVVLWLRHQYQWATSELLITDQVPPINTRGNRRSSITLLWYSTNVIFAEPVFFNSKKSGKPKYRFTSHFVVTIWYGKKVKLNLIICYYRKYYPKLS